MKHFRGEPLSANCLENLVIEDTEFTEDAQNLIDAVVNFYGKYSGIQLSALTHKKGSPWEKTYAGTGQRWISIPDNVIKDHFDKLNRQND